MELRCELVSYASSTVYSQLAVSSPPSTAPYSQERADGAANVWHDFVDRGEEACDYQKRYGGVRTCKIASSAGRIDVENEPSAAIHAFTASDNDLAPVAPIQTEVSKSNAGRTPVEACRSGKPAQSAGTRAGGGKRQKNANTDENAREGSKKAAVIAMMKRAKGATLSDIMATTGWQAHTVRGMISILGSKGGVKLESSKNTAGERTYCIVR